MGDEELVEYILEYAKHGNTMTFQNHVHDYPPSGQNEDLIVKEIYSLWKKNCKCKDLFPISIQEELMLAYHEALLNHSGRGEYSEHSDVFFENVTPC